MALTLQQVAKHVGRDTHIAPIDLTLETGSVNVLLGLTLAGKTSLMRLMAGLDKPSAGRVLVDGQDVTGMAVQKRDVAMVYQQFVNYPSLTTYDNIASPLRLARVEKSEIDRRVRAEAERLRIDGLLDRLPAELSGGQQQRMAMARALVREANLIMLDEPLVNLDYKLREALREDLPRVFAGRNSIVVYASTDPWEALSLGGTTIAMHEGRIVQAGPAPEVYAAPATTHVGQIFSDPPMNFGTGRIDNGRVFLGEDDVGAVPAHLAELADGQYTFGLRPEHIEIHDPAHHSSRIDTHVDVTEVTGSETFIHFIYHDQPWVSVETGVVRMEAGESVAFGFSADNLFAFDTDGMRLVSPESSAPTDGDGQEEAS
ncbi:ABC transporter ATP-binding protein [Salinisphaera orenii]|uniref:ABC transporter ATP-binding protein n=1 Tax=Salinisphaera orenii TaxID=856731 RepID=UPI000DBE5109